MLFKDGRISVRKMNNTDDDKNLLLKWLTTPEVIALAYGENAPWDMEKIEEHFVSKTLDNSIITACFIEYDSKPIGYVQFYPTEFSEFKFISQVPNEQFTDIYGIDIFIGYPDFWGMEIGTNTVISMSDYLMNVCGAKVVCAGPEEHNQRSVRCWIKAGFSPIGIVENYDDHEKRDILMAKFKKNYHCSLNRTFI